MAFDFTSLYFINWYKNTTDLLASAQNRGEKMASYLDDMLSILSSSEIHEENIDRQLLESSIHNAYDIIVSNHVRYSPQLQTFVRVLQKFISDGYGGINSFLLNNSILVKQAFADISEYVGYPIDDSNIEQNPSDME